MQRGIERGRESERGRKIKHRNMNINSEVAKILEKNYTFFVHKLV